MYYERVDESSIDKSQNKNKNLNYTSKIDSDLFFEVFEKLEIEYE